MDEMPEKPLNSAHREEPAIKRAAPPKALAWKFAIPVAEVLAKGLQSRDGGGDDKEKTEDQGGPTPNGREGFWGVIEEESLARLKQGIATWVRVWRCRTAEQRGLRRGCRLHSDEQIAERIMRSIASLSNRWLESEGPDGLRTYLQTHHEAEFDDLLYAIAHEKAIQEAMNEIADEVANMVAKAFSR